MTDNSKGSSTSSLKNLLKDFEVMLVLQGGGARGAYQVGVYQALRELGAEPDWVCGISMGAINAAIMAGNPDGRRLAALEGFWNSVATPFDVTNLMNFPGAEIFKYYAASMESSMGYLYHRNFYSLRPVPWFMAPPGSDTAVSYYDPKLLEINLQRWIAWDEVNNGDGPALSLGVTNVKNGRLEFFHSEKQSMDSQHVMAASAMPPGSPYVRIDGEAYWDGGLAGNEPLMALIGERVPDRPVLLIVVDLWSGEAEVPQNIMQVTWRQYQIQYMSKIASLLNMIKKQLPQPPQAPDGAPVPDLPPPPPGTKPPPVVVTMHLVYDQSVAIEPYDAVDFSINSIVERRANGLADTIGALKEIVPDLQAAGQDKQCSLRSFLGQKPVSRPPGA